MLLLGIDLGTSAIKVSIIDAENQKVITSVSFPETEVEIISPEIGWAEQSPELWWEHTIQAILKAHATHLYNPKDIKAIGISYQMHGLIAVDQNHQVLYNSIIWCDSRAIEIGAKALDYIGREQSLKTLLNFPGNFTASKLAWLKTHEPEVYQRIYKVLLPGDFLTMKLTAELNTTASALSEGIFWDFQQNSLSDDIFNCFGFDKSLIPAIHPVFAVHGQVTKEVAALLNLSSDVKVSYKAGDQPNNAFSLNVLENGEVAATAGTSGVIYAVSDQLIADPQSRVNSFAHVNYLPAHIRTGMLLCINGTGILNRWVKNLLGDTLSYAQMNDLGAQSPIASKGIKVLPFGNGAERMLNNKNVGSDVYGIDFNRHGRAEIIRAAQEGIACAFRYGLDLMRNNGVQTKVIKAGKANLFLSDLFTHSFVNVTDTVVELYDHDGSAGAAMGAGVGIGYYVSPQEAVQNIKKIQVIEPSYKTQYEELYQDWNKLLTEKLNK